MNRALKLTSMMEDCGLVDLGAIGGKFTRFRRSEGSKSISKRLDRAISECDWRSSFSETYVGNLLRHHSNHYPVLLRCKGVTSDRNTFPFRFQAAWLQHKDFPQVVNSAWIKGNQVVTKSLDKAKEDALVFNSEVFGNIINKKLTLAARLRGIQRTLERSDILGLLLLEVVLQREYNDVLKQEEMLWYQKSREKWVRFGDRNTRFFHTWTIIRRARNKVQGLLLDNEW